MPWTTSASSSPQRRARPPRAGLAGSTLFAALVVAASCTTVRVVSSPDVPPPMPDLGEESAYSAASRVKLPKTLPEERPGLHNVFALSPNIIAGSEPHGEEAFRALREMGVKTILTVDGKVPDAALAARHGIAYVHVPVQYRGFTPDEMLRIAKTFREKEGPFYVHCFHGQHRGPAAAAVGRVVVDGATREQAIAEMRQWCGTSKSYEGLYRAIADGDIPDEARTRAYAWDFPPAHVFKGFRGAMVEVSRADDNLKYLSKRGWEPGEDHPDADPQNDATRLAMSLERTSAIEYPVESPEEFRAQLRRSVEEAKALRDEIAAWKKGLASLDSVSGAYRRVATSCNDCHDVFRNR